MRALFQSIGTSAASRSLSIGLSLVSVPLALGYLGTEQYGLWATVTSVISVLVFADLGVGNGMLNAIASANGQDNMAGVRSAIACGVSIVSIVAIVFLILFLAVWPFVDWARIFKIHGEAATYQVSIALLLLMITFAINMPVSIIQKVQYGLQEGRWVSLSQAIAALLGLSMTLAVVHFDLGLIGMVGCFVLGALIADFCVGLVFFVRRPEIVPKLIDFNKAEFKQFFRVGMSFLLLQVAVSLCYASDNLILAQMVSHEAVAVYSVHQKLFSPLTFIATLALTPMWPAFSDAIARHDIRWVKRALAISCALMFCWALVGGCALLLTSGWLMQHWLTGQIQPDLAIGVALVIWASVDLVGRAIAMFANGAGLLKQQMIGLAFFVPLCIGLKIWFVYVIGPSGVVVGTTVAWLLVNLPNYWIIIQRWARDAGKQIERTN